MEPVYLTIRQTETGKRIRQLLTERGYTVRDIQAAMGFENPQAVYKWLSGRCLPSLDNILILSKILHTNIEDILVIDGDVPVHGDLLSGCGKTATHFQSENVLCTKMRAEGCPGYWFTNRDNFSRPPGFFSHLSGRNKKFQTILKMPLIPGLSHIFYSFQSV